MHTLIVEDLLLLLLDDETGRVAGETTLPYVLGGAVLAELALAERIRVEPKTSAWASDTVHAVGDEPLDDALLDDAFVVLREEPRAIQDALRAFSQDLQHRVTDRLVHRGLLREAEGKVLLVFRTTTWPAADTRHEAELRAAIGQVLVDGEEPDPRTATLIGLVYASGELGRVLRYPDAAVSKREIQQRAKALAEHGVGAQAVGDAVAAAHTAAMTATMATVVAIMIPTTGAGGN